MRALPPGWRHTSLGEVLDRIEAGKSFSGEPRQAGDDEWGIIKISAMTYGTFRDNDNKAVPSDVEIPKELEIRSGDLLISRANTRDYVGASVVVGDCRSRLLLSDKSLRLHTSSAVDRRWLWYALSSPQARQYIGEASTGVKASMRNISQRALRAVPLLLPPLDEQRRIVEILEDHLSRLDAADGELATASTRSKIMHKSTLISLIPDVDKYFAFRRLKNFACAEVHPQTKTLLVYVKVSPDDIELESGFSRDVRSIGHFGTGDLELKIASHADLERALPLVQRSYEAS